MTYKTRKENTSVVSATKPLILSQYLTKGQNKQVADREELTFIYSEVGFGFQILVRLEFVSR